MFFQRRFGGLTIAFSFVQTHNQFVLDRDDRVFNRTAPIIKLAQDSGEDNHLELLGILNSSIACFWLKQVSHNKGNEGYFSGFKAEAWERFYEFTGTKLQDFPLPSVLPLESGRALDALGQRLSGVQPSSACANRIPTRDRLEKARAEQASIRGQMIALEGELDWEVYQLDRLL